MSSEQNVAPEAANEEVSLRDELASGFAKMSEEAPAQEPVAEDAPQQEAPVEETAEQREDRERDELGRFKAKEEAEQPEKPAEEQPAPEEPKKDDEKYAGPPPGWSVTSKAAFDELPESVKQDISKREREIDQGFAKLKEYKQLEPYSQMARQAGMELPELMERYKAAEDYLQRDTKNAILWMCQNYGVDPRELAGGAQQQQPQQAQQKVDPSVEPLLQKINQLEQQLGRVDTLEQSIYADKAGQINSQVEKFFADPANKFAENVSDQMVVLINEANASGESVDLNKIYETACYMNPEVRDALINEKLTAEQKAQASKAKQAADQARQAGASISGGSSATAPTAEPDSSNLRALLEQNMAAQMGRT